MNSFVLEELTDELALACEIVTEADQKYVKEHILVDDCQDMFPMVSNEFTNDSEFTVDINESKFLNDKNYDYTWLIGKDYDENMNYVLCLKSYEKEKTLSIEVFEVNKDMRGQGIGANVISIIESVAQNYFDFITVSPFDTDAINFWEHMEYNKGKNGQWIKKL